MKKIRLITLISLLALTACSAKTTSSKNKTLESVSYSNKNQITEVSIAPIDDPKAFSAEGKKLFEEVGQYQEKISYYQYELPKNLNTLQLWLTQITDGNVKSEKEVKALPLLKNTGIIALGNGPVVAEKLQLIYGLIEPTTTQSIQTEAFIYDLPKMTKPVHASGGVKKVTLQKKRYPLFVYLYTDNGKLSETSKILADSQNLAKYVTKGQSGYLITVSFSEK